MNQASRIFVLAVALALLLASALAWALPVETFQNWAVERAGPDEYGKLEAMGQSTALMHLGRVLLPLASAAILACLWNWDSFSRTAFAAVRGWLDATHCGTGRAGGARTLCLRMLTLAWLLLAGRHVVNAVDQRTREWVYFGLRSGEEVLPNISFQNRDVIRYLREATPPGSKILVLSDQKLFFLAYYLLPRELYHPMHPDAEFVIPQADQQRPLAAYTREDLSTEYLDALQPDYILEYFETAAYVNPSRVTEDERWIAFWRRRHGPRGAPGHLVSLQPYRGSRP